MGLFGFDEQYAMFDMTPVENQFLLEYMPSAKGDAVKVYLYGLMQCYHPQEDMSVAQMGHELGMSEEEILTAYRYWERKGLVRRISDFPPTFRYINVNKLMFTGGLPQTDAAYEAFAEALYALFGNDFRLHGKAISQYYEWVEDMHLPQEVVLKLIEHMIAVKGKNFSAKAAQKLAVELAEAGAQTAEDAEAVLGRDKKVLEGSRAVLRQFNLFRDPTQPEMNLYHKWMTEWGFTQEAIEAACEDTTNGKQPSFKYLDTILKNKRDSMEGEQISVHQVKQNRDERTKHEEPLRQLLKVMNIQGVTVNDSTLAVYDDMRALYPDEVILIAGQQCARRGGKLDDVMALLMSWKQKKLQSVAEVQEYIQRFNEYNSLVQALYQAWGKEGRPTAAGRTMVQKWQEVWGFTPEMIIASAAYAAGAEKPLPYLDKLLAAFHEQGIATPERAAEAHQAWKERNGVQPAKPKAGKTVREQQYEQREYHDTDEMPEWMMRQWKEMNGGA